MKKLPIKQALTDMLSGCSQPVITSYDLGVMVHNLYLAGKYQGQPLFVRKEVPELSEMTVAIKDLLSNRILEPFKRFRSVYKIFGKDVVNEEDVVCSINPFAYISHLSAMEYHGLTEKIPRVLIYSAPDNKTWKSLAQKKMQKDYTDNLKNILTPLSFIQINKFGKKNLILFRSASSGSYINVKNRPFRVSSIGRTFLDMIRRPDLCGGIYTVIQAYENFGEQYLGLILDEIDRHGNKIEKVRAGYILEDRCIIKNDLRIEKWKIHAQRGGSRKLDPNNVYSSVYSEPWCLSINIEEESA